MIGGTPEVWQKVGLNALPVTINQKHVDYALNGTKDKEHNIGEGLLKQFPEMIKHPVAIIQSQSIETRPVVILSGEHNGKRVIIPLEVDGYGRVNDIIIDSNAITSAFAKNNALSQMNKAIGNTIGGATELFYWNKKEALSLLQKAGLQLPSVLPQDGFIHSIRENSSKVNPKFKNVTETQQFKRWFGDWQNNPKKASKVVNEDGTPKVVYHGTDAEFTVFDKNKFNSTEKSGDYVGEGSFRKGKGKQEAAS